MKDTVSAEQMLTKNMVGSRARVITSGFMNHTSSNVEVVATLIKAFEEVVAWYVMNDVA